jgi:uncharacterized protein DUF5677
LADCDRILQHAIGMFENWTGRGIESTADGLVVAILARSTDTFTCSLRSVRLGYGAQAAMLNRSLFEDMVDAHWLITDPETAQARYLDHHEHSRMLLADAVATFPTCTPISTSRVRPGRAKASGQSVRGLRQKPWSGLSLHERVKLIKDQWTTKMDREGLRFMHAVAHRENNQTLHVSAQSLGAVAAPDDRGRPAFRVGPRPDMVRRAMFGTYVLGSRGPRLRGEVRLQFSSVPRRRWTSRSRAASRCAPRRSAAARSSSLFFCRPQRSSSSVGKRV